MYGTQHSGARKIARDSEFADVGTPNVSEERVPMRIARGGANHQRDHRARRDRGEYRVVATPRVPSISVILRASVRAPVRIAPEAAGLESNQYSQGT